MASHFSYTFLLVRLDLFLKASRLVLRRSAAQELCDVGAVFINGQAAKSSKEVKIGDEVRIARRNRITVARIARIPAGKQVSKSDAASLFELIEDTSVEDELLTRGSA